MGKSFSKFIFLSLLPLWLSPLQAQDWRAFFLEQMDTTVSPIWVLGTTHPYGMVIKNIENPLQPNRFWLVGDLWFLSPPEETDAYYVFGNHSNQDLNLWAIGYSLKGKVISLIRIYYRESSLKTKIVHQKSVEIINREDKYVFKCIFYRRTGEVQLDVNGVPMRLSSPLPIDSINTVGYLISRGTVKFKQMKIEGD